MANNISKYISLNDFVLLEYEFNKDGVETNFSNLGISIATDELGNKFYFNNNLVNSLGVTNTTLEFLAIPTNQQRTNWYNNSDDVSTYNAFFTNIDSSIALTTTSYPCDTVKLHLVSGYNVDDISAILLQIRCKDNSSNMVDLFNFIYAKQSAALASSDVLKFNSNTLHLGNKFYDKYLEFKVPSIQQLGGDVVSDLGQKLNIQQLSDVYITYSSIQDINNYQFVLSELLNVNLPVTSIGDNFNCFIAESTNNDYIEFYGMWANQIIGSYMGQIESGQIRLYTSNNPNDNYEEFANIYGVNAKKWILMHEIFVYENMPSITGGTSLLTQKYTFTQEDNFSLPNYFRPVLKNSDIDASFTISYTCRLMNRMDGSQIIRKASFASTNPKKYGLQLTRLNVENIIPYKVFNRLEAETSNIVQGNNLQKTKYVKVFYDTSNILLNELNEVFPQGAGPLLLKNSDSVYKFKFEKLNTTTQIKTNVDLSGAYNYQLYFTLDDNTNISVSPTYSSNMNTTVGEIEFKLTGDQINKLFSQKNNRYSIKIMNPDGTSYVFYEGSYYKYSDLNTVLTNFATITNVNELNKQIVTLQSQIKSLQDENETLKTN